MSYKLTYFDIAARGEPARLIFSAAGVKFTDNRVKFPDWPALKQTLEWGQLPVLEIGDKKLTQSKTIYRYLGRKFKLAGSDEWESAKCDELVDAVSDLVEEFGYYTFKVQDPAKKEELKKLFYSASFPNFLSKINKIQMENGGTWLIGKNLTWADIVVSEFLRQMSEAGDPAILNGYPHVRKMKEAVFAFPNIKTYIDNKK